MDTETKAVRDGVEARHDPQTFIAAFLDGARLLTPDPHFVVVENPGYVPDNGVDPYLGCETPMAVAILTEMLTGVSAAPSAAGGGAIPEGWALLPLEATEAMWQAGRDADAHPTDSYSAVWDAMVAAALSPSQGSNTREAGRELPPQCEIWCGRRTCEDRGCDGRFPDGSPVPPPTAPQGADLAGLSEDEIVRRIARVLALAHPGSVAPTSGERGEATFQARNAAWMTQCFDGDPTDLAERRDRFLEEALELGQSLDGTREDAHRLVDYVFDRSKGEPGGEFGGMLTTAACLAAYSGHDLMACGEAELARISTAAFIAKLRGKRATRHGRGPLPGYSAHGTSEPVAPPPASRNEGERP